MKRTIFDVPLWSLYLHRTVRGLPRADPSDPVERALKDDDRGASFVSCSRAH